MNQCSFPGSTPLPAKSSKLAPRERNPLDIDHVSTLDGCLLVSSASIRISRMTTSGMLQISTQIILISSSLSRMSCMYPVHTPIIKNKSNPNMMHLCYVTSNAPLNNGFIFINSSNIVKVSPNSLQHIGFD